MKWTRAKQQPGLSRGTSPRGTGTVERGSESGMFWWMAIPSVGAFSSQRHCGQKGTLEDAKWAVARKLGELVG